ncbi:16S rRNA (cytosine(1402)-N(4))-methyltransferase RsmH [Actinotignum timonense]|uniref:Ribosomal RNA small subunit methyltransferase H n=1 Tax=Actinotignum timonense TaxID=1870995 RepID=A0ABU5GA98_9ACTO|nr:16S rRNA (cytosine(1402)-N(4))-methyltransferase RsmH [Actinotignum timonense]MDK6906582.1 16S rRNA (cytosine(1402)-N(4))-methyltransferase RsmH [Actinotignum timonense]MDK8782395.1 16S rRNA (cytosine(1402)-N(4))-methyltransferase RsmH [Actinotignum timonense]MDY5138632.1 16S rRNA (cytosine(1402)-N(4))-methyltransferase RsmH [Actinotignum timonense]MDY5143621.1 16S rRNA (cytosine(1402)-N(4))-methyltransferase RsmH [Actinotignum timonense]MDY5145591.1 16S rRNA (cytosine(1402)-N(4))-methyltra
METARTPGAPRAAGNALHAPVLVDTCIELLAPAFQVPTPVLIDCTLGMGGHTEAFLERFENLTVIGIDRDPAAIALAGERLARFGQRFRPVQTTYDDVTAAAGNRPVDGILMDLGVSSLQLDETERGFSYSHDAPLDMRMNAQVGRTAADILAGASVRELTRILREYGEEKFAHRIATAIVERRASAPLTRTGELVEIVRSSIPAPARRTGGNPAKRTFQALRIAVNDELGTLERALPAALATLRVGGRIVVEAYQSLEDRLVKRAFAAGATSRAPRGLPVELEEHKPWLELLTRGAIQADEEEITRNSRSASVRLRAAEKIRPGGQL